MNRKDTYMTKNTRGAASLQSRDPLKSRNIHDSGVEPPFVLSGEALHVLEDGALASVRSCAECGSAFLSAPGAGGCPLCGSDLVADAGTERSDYRIEIDMRIPARDFAADPCIWKGGSGPEA